jgi:microcin C transport system substrate-binding protein
MRSIESLIIVLFVVLLTGCGRQAEEAVAYDNTEEVEQYYAEHPDVFRFATLADVPEGLDWQDGSGLTPYADPKAKRGGSFRLRLARLQSTFRVVGPEANGSLRHPLWNSNSVPLVALHPWEDGYHPGLAMRWAVLNTTPQQLFFELDPEARWSDGRPVTTDDFLFSLYVLRSPYINDPAINRVFEESYARITRYDERTFSVTLGKPTPDPLAQTDGLSILFQREFYREFGPDYTDRYHSRFAPVTGPLHLVR